MTRKIESADDVEDALGKAGIQYRNGRDKTREADLDPRTFSTLRWQEGETFSAPRAAYFTGILKLFKIIVFLGAVVAGISGYHYFIG